MINALRHQRLVHIASFWDYYYFGGDQRLTASKVSTLARPAQEIAGDYVINALRHQRLVHNLSLVLPRFI